MRAGTIRRRAIGAVAFAVATVVTLAGCSAAPEDDVVEAPAQVAAAFPEGIQGPLQDAVSHAMGATGSSGAIVGVWAPWSGSWVSGVGTQQPGGAPVTEDMEFRAAQVTRPMTCDVLYEVAASGAVALDDPVTDYVSGAPDLRGITLEQLCDSTSGIGAYGPHLIEMWKTNPERVWNPRELASYGLGQPRPNSPGDAYRESDAGYVLLGLALERATGESARALIDRYVADPLDLTATTLPGGRPAAPSSGGTPLTGLLSLPGEGGALNCAEPTDISIFSASTGFTDAGVVSNVADLGRYVQALASGATTPDAYADERFANGKPPTDGAPSWYNTAGGALLAGSLVGGFGSVPGYATAAYSDAATGLTVVVVLNNSAAGAAPAGYLAWELAAIASKAPAASGETAPEAGLPWTPEQYHEAIAAGAVCAPAG